MNTISQLFQKTNSKIAALLLAVVVIGGLALHLWNQQPVALLAPGENSAQSQLKPPIDKLLSIHKAYNPRAKGHWDPKSSILDQRHPTYDPTVSTPATSSQNTIYIQPIGNISPAWHTIIKKTAHFISRLFCVKVIGLQPVTGQDFPEQAVRRNNFSGVQLHSAYITDHYLTQSIPEDALALIAFSEFDLWPGGKSRFSIAHSNLAKRTAVWSLFRLGRPDTTDGYQRALRRTLKLTAHEIGHFIGLDNSTQHFGLMNGSNSLREAESQPLFLSPPALQFVMDRSSCSLDQRFSQLKEFFFKNNMPSHGRQMEASLKLLNK